MFCNKKVCIIGPAPNLIGTNSGKLIDSYDIVCRVNSSYIIKSELYNDYGKKCDVLLSTCNPTICDAMKTNLDYLKNCKLIINPTKKFHTGEEKSAEYLVKKVTNIPFYQVPQSWYNFMNHKYKTLNTGLLSIFFILEQKPKELFIGGMSFYENKNIEDNYIFDHHNTYKNNPKNLPNTENEKLLKGDKTKYLPSKYLNGCKTIFKNHIMIHKNVKIHDTIKNLL